MKTSIWTENPIAQAYDRNFALLESAREEYQQAISALLSRIESELQKKQSSWALDEGLVIELARTGQGLVQSIECRLAAANKRWSQILILIRPGAPSGGSAATVQLALIANLNENLGPMTIPHLKQNLQDEQALQPSAASEQNLVGTREIPISANIATEVAAAVRKIVEWASPFAAQVDADYRLTERMRLFLTSLGQDLKRSETTAGWNVGIPSRPWGGMYYVPLDRPGHPSFWIGFHITEQRILYGHTVPVGDHAFAERFFASVKAREPRDHAGHPAGTIFSRQEAAFHAEDEFRKRLFDLIARFTRMVTEPSS